VHVTELRLRHFRNLGVQELSFPPEGAAIIGANAQGKSNLLEALYYLETFRSFRGAPDDQLVAFDQEVFRVEGAVQGGEGGALSIAAAFQTQGRVKRVQIDGGTRDRLSDALGCLGAVIFSPGDVELVSGGPQGRRRFLDILLSLNEPSYLSRLQEYRKALARRNASLRAARPQIEVAAWDAPLVRAGAQVMARRALWTAQRAEAFRALYRSVSGARTAQMRYQPDVGTGDRAPSDANLDARSAEQYAEKFAERFHAKLAGSEARARRLGYTPVGPHRDELALELEPDGSEPALDLRSYGSGGERRTAALALRLIEARTIMENRGHPPLVLLDDAFAELDDARSERVLALLEEEGTGQVVLTAPKAADVRLRKDALPRWRIEAGVVLAA